MGNLKCWKQDKKTILYQKVFMCRDLGKELGRGWSLTIWLIGEKRLRFRSRMGWKFNHFLKKTSYRTHHKGLLYFGRIPNWKAQKRLSHGPSLGNRHSAQFRRAFSFWKVLLDAFEWKTRRLCGTKSDASNSRCRLRNWWKSRRN